ncbi:extracellular solute-binding protein [Konateibacter massiliensis]|uniref:extracellular solute-binding protein n=1 Tax=Konateibacter massiliensis TaxID=2002841 RepID=UPI0015D4CD7C|nr:extracellular solute-binding protein [Konateibacter massiliensis]
MKRMIKRVLSVGLCFVLIGVMAGCNLKVQEKEEVSTAAVEETTQIVLWYTNEELSEYIDKAAKEYEADNAVKVKTKLVSSIDYIETINQAVLEEDSAPDLFIAESSNLEKIYLAGLALEHTEEVSKENYYETARNAFTYNDKLLAYPLYFETSYLLYNQDYVENAPSTIDDILSFSEEFDAPEGVEAIFNWDVTDILCNYFFIGKYLNNDEIDNENYIADREKLREAFQYYQNLNQYFAIDAQTVDYETSFQNFVDGKSVFTIAKTDKLPEIELIEGDISEDVQNEQTAEDMEASEADEAGAAEAEENQNSEAENEKSAGQSDEQASKDSEANGEGIEEESEQNKENIDGLTSYAAGVERIFKPETTEVLKENEKDSTSETVSESETTEAAETPAPSETTVSTPAIIDKNSSFKIVPLPNLTTELASRGIAVNYGVFVNGYTTKEEAAKAFAKYLTYDKGSYLYQEAGKLSARSDIDYQNENIANILKQYETDTNAPKIMENGDFWLKLEISFANIWKGESVEESIAEIEK